MLKNNTLAWARPSWKQRTQRLLTPLTCCRQHCHLQQTVSRHSGEIGCYNSGNCCVDWRTLNLGDRATHQVYDHSRSWLCPPLAQTDEIKTELAPGQSQLSWLQFDTPVAPVLTTWLQLPSHPVAHCCAAAAAVLPFPLYVHSLSAWLTKTLFCLCLMSTQYITPDMHTLRLQCVVGKTSAKVVSHSRLGGKYEH